jgi:ADP-heptose:LPS heptosyltransferase
MEKQKKSKGIRLLLSAILSRQAALRLIRLRYGKRLGSGMVEFPLDTARYKRVLVILPEDPLEALHQTNTVLSLKQLFSTAEVSLLCTGPVADFFRLLPGITTIIDYAVADRYLFSRAFGILCGTIEQADFDACFLLEKNPHPALLRAVAAAGAACRIGFYDSAELPFVNVRIRPSGKHSYLSDANTVLPQAIGGQAPKPLKWSVPKESLQEIRHTLKEHAINPDATVVGLDAALFFRQFGKQWLEMLVTQLNRCNGISLVCVAEPEMDPEFLAWLKQHSVGIVPPVSIARLAALIQHSFLQITGNSIAFQLGCLLGKPTIGLFSQAELQTYFKPASYCRAAAFETAPDAQTVALVAGYLAEFGLPGTTEQQPSAQTG